MKKDKVLMTAYNRVNSKRKNITYEECLLAVKFNPNVIPKIPQEYVIDIMYKEFIEKNTPYLIPEIFRNIGVYFKFLSITKFSKKYRNWLEGKETEYPEKDRKIYRALESFISMLSDDVFFDRSIIDKERELLIRKVLESEYDSDKKEFIIREKFYSKVKSTIFTNFQEYYEYLDCNLNGANLTEYNFSEIDVSKYNLSGVYLSSDFLIGQGEYNDSYYKSYIEEYNKEDFIYSTTKNENNLITSRYECENVGVSLSEANVYYVSDIHLNHRLLERFPNNATKDEVRFFIRKYVRKMVDKASYGYLLIGGDVSFSFEISRVFYEELCRVWAPSKIIVVLGNHELWGVDLQNEINTDNIPEIIIEKYRLLFESLGIKFLYNSLLLNNEILNCQAIMGKSIEELQKLALRCNFFVYGTVGFSGYNSEFNANNGLYRNTINTLEQDTKYTMQSEAVYKKICQVLKKDSVIVLSHMPVKDWIKGELMPNWIYVNGHTHRNYYEQSEKCIIYADNQVGYKLKQAKLKYFRKSTIGDIFKYYDDGIYRVSRSEYLDFNRHKYIGCQFNADVEYIIMLKRQDMYMFLLEDVQKNKLFLLNGGKKNKLNNNINYYFENMIKYSDYIKVSLKKYNSVLENISAIVKTIGGSGFIHGAIVDIDFYNHIHLDPQTGKISAYYSPIFGDIWTYKSIENLLQSQTTKLYLNYKKIVEMSENNLPILSSGAFADESSSALDMSMYKYSNLIKRLQYMVDKNVIRIWNDDFVTNYEQYLNEEKYLLIEE